jgi:hypothetical protein
MRQPKKILVPVDLSKRSEIGVAYAAMMAETTGAELVVMANVSRRRGSNSSNRRRPGAQLDHLDRGSLLRSTSIRNVG